MASGTHQVSQTRQATDSASLFVLGLLFTVYGALILVDVLAVALNFGGVLFNVGPPMPQDWFPNMLVGMSITGSGVIATMGARRNMSWAAVVGLVIALAAVYEIVLLDRLYVFEGRPALSISEPQDASLQDRFDRIYSSGILRKPPPYRP